MARRISWLAGWWLGTQMSTRFCLEGSINIPAGTSAAVFHSYRVTPSWPPGQLGGLARCDWHGLAGPIQSTLLRISAPALIRSSDDRHAHMVRGGDQAHPADASISAPLPSVNHGAGSQNPPVGGRAGTTIVLPPQPAAQASWRLPHDGLW